MKKFLPLALIFIVVGGFWFYSTSRPSQIVIPQSTAKAGSNTEPAIPQSSATLSGNLNAISNSGTTPEDLDQGVNIKPAAETYKSADEALAAVLKAAKDYDDSVLEQFTKPGNNCAWCPEFYASVKDLLGKDDTAPDQKSYLAEIMAISGRVENVQTLVEEIKSAKSSETGDLFSEALELSVGGDDVTKYLGDQMTSTNETLRESSVAAVTNQGSRLAAELLLKHTLERGDPDGYYALGIGPGEFIPDEEAIPVFQEALQKGDLTSPLAAKALVNSGMNGLRILFDELDNSKDPEASRRLIKDVIDHVNFEDGLEEFTKKRIDASNSPVLKELGQQILDQVGQGGQGATIDGDGADEGN